MSQLIFFLLGSFNNQPPWVRYLYMVMFVVMLTGVGVFANLKVAMMVGGGILLVVLIVGIFLYLVRRARQKRAASFSGDMQQAASATPGAISDPARRARLSELRESFEKGLAKFRASGKDFYQLPWYVIVGEPGAGKTEAIRHSNIDFPPGMNDEFQGVGGTINMNWWFTNDAVILDTAGRLVFEEIEPGQTSEWVEFLALLRKHRPDCPINGLLVVIPAESLIKDSEEEIRQKAGKLARQLEVIQKQLDVRFPASVLVSKCDLLNGFREFFEDIHDVNAEQQMVGWANPEPLDTPFNPEQVDGYIRTVTARLNRRRLGLLLDPVARDSKKRRADEVDRLYALPHSIELIAGNLRKYLTMIFIKGEWTVKPLFLRGIFFTSSMREGSSLDQELANAVGLSVDLLPQKRAWERDRAYFLRDLFKEKTFREWGLVTRATNTRSLLRRRRVVLFGAGCAALFTLLALAFFGHRSLQESTGRQAGYWARASEGWDGDSWKPIVRRETGSAWKFSGNEPVGAGSADQTRLLFDRAKQPLSEFHATLLELSRTPLKMSMAFRPMPKFGINIDADRARAQRVVFDDGVVKPVVEAARERMSAAAIPSSDLLDEANALLSLVRMEAAIVRRREGRPMIEYNAENVLRPLLQYTAKQEREAGLEQTMDRTYSGKAGVWPADWLSGGATLSDNVAISRGLDRFVADARRVLASETGGMPLINSLIEDVRKFASIEDDLAATTATRAPIPEMDQRVLTAYENCKKANASLTQHLDQAKQAGVFEGGPVSLRYAYEKLTRDVRVRYEVASAIQTEINALLNKVEGVGAAKRALQNAAGEQQRYVLFREISAKLGDLVSQMQARFGTPLPARDLTEIGILDQNHLATTKAEPIQYQSRWSLYKRSMVVAEDPRTDPRRLAQVGEDWKLLRAVLANIAETRKEVANYAGIGKEKVVPIATYCLARAETIYADVACRAYLEEATKRITTQLRFPLLWEPYEGGSLKPEEFLPAVSLIEKIGADLASPVFQNIKAPGRAPLLDLQKRLSTLNPVRDALLTPDRGVRLVKVVLLNRREQFELSGQQVGTDAFKAIEARAGTIDHGAVVKGVDARVVPTDSPSDVELGRFKLYEPFHFHVYRSAADRTWTEAAAPRDWTAIRFLFENNGTPIDNGARWRVPIRMAGGKSIWLEFQFERPLPPFDDWPSRRSLGLSAPAGR